MRIKRSCFIWGVSWLFFSTLFVTSCSDIAPIVRKVTYPPDFNYVSGEDLRSRMNQMAAQIQLLDQALFDTTGDEPDRQRQVVAVLRQIEKVGSSLSAGEAGSSHPFLEDFMDEFVADVGQARNAAALSPPRYYLAGRVTGSCAGCHKVNR